MKGKRLDISASDMLTLREQGFSNKDISNMLDLPLSTVYRYIGGQERRMESITSHMDQKPKAVPTPPPPPPPKHTEAHHIKIINQTVGVDGYCFLINHGNKSVTVSLPGQDSTINLAAGEIEKFSAALLAVQKFIDEKE